LFALALASLAASRRIAVHVAQSKPSIGIGHADKILRRWIDDGNNIVKVLKERGYGTDLPICEDDIPNQLRGRDMVTGSQGAVIARSTHHALRCA